ncbi:MAG: hypothetical protein B6I19_03825 [Bacteroidetes bacterium 4572_114]|nr:MAG: hypothetical protein B6I19_03825 [Bacteroidetes bacterium 4572_114]
MILLHGLLSTWPSLSGGGFSIIKGPDLPEDGYNASHIFQWETVFTAADYEADDIVASTYIGGALHSFGEYLYFGSMHIPLLATLAHFELAPPQTLEDTLFAFLGTHRATTIFRGKDFGQPNQDIEIMYGMLAMPAWDPVDGWNIKPNKLNKIPKWGPPGIWNFFNNYTWTMEAHEDQLYIGTMDFSSILFGIPDWEELIQAFDFTGLDNPGLSYTQTKDGFNLPNIFIGADLFKICNDFIPAVPLRLNGLGNYANYGIRTMAEDGDKLYLGTANPFNLSPDGGWELIQLEDNTYEIFNDFSTKLLTKNEPDETFYGIGDPRNNYNPYVPHFTTDSTIAKHNQSYVWGMTSAEDNVWFGTGPNVLEMVLGAYLQVTTPYQSCPWVAEFGESQFSPPYPPELGDWRPARVFMWDDSSKTRVEKTPPMAQAPVLQSTLGLRSAGTIGDLIILAGTNVAEDFGINFLAYNNATGEFLGYHQIKDFDGDTLNNIRKWINADGIAYTGISGLDFGYILKWTGTVDDPFQYEIVGKIPASPSEFTFHEGRLVTSCWPGGGELGSGGALPGVYYSPVVPPDGLDVSHQAQWELLWQSSDYEVDPVMAAMMAGGAIESYEGKLYWGTMHVPFMATLAHFITYFQNPGIEPTVEQILEGIALTQRAVSIFRANNIGEPDQEIELLYGQEMVTAFQPGVGWQCVPNASGLEPLYGFPGFGSPFNNYTWTMDIYSDQLFVGTMDWSYLIPSMLPFIIDQALPLIFPEKQFEITIDDLAEFLLPVPFSGADIWRFRDGDSKALPVTLRGMGNKRNYGIRAMATGHGKLYLGTANAMNLHPEGGWELYSLMDVSTDFYADKPISNPGTDITFFPVIYGNEQDSLIWYFPQSDIPSSTQKNPVVTYSQPGYYNVTLIVFIGGQTYTTQKVIYIDVLPPDEAQCTDLFEGWMGISSYMLPFDPDIEAITGPLVVDPKMGELIIMISETGFYWPPYNINTLTDWQPDRGYKIKMTGDAYNCIVGDPLTNMDLPQPEGVHLLPVITDGPVLAADVFGSCATLQYGFDYINNGIYWPDGNVMTLDTLYPGLAYLIKITDECTFIFPEPDNQPGHQQGVVKRNFINPTTIWNSPAQTGTTHIFSVYPEALEQFSPDDVIGAFNENGACVGMGQIDDIRKNLGLVVYANDQTTSEIDGCIEGEVIEFRVLEASAGEARINPVFDEVFEYHNGKFASNGFSGISEFKFSGTGLNTDLIPGLEIYPNPAKEKLNIIYPDVEDETNILIYNANGQQVFSANLVEDHTILDIVKFEKGIYFIKITNNSNVVVKQMVKN